MVPEVHTPEVPVPMMVGLVTNVTVLKPAAMVLLVPVPVMVGLVTDVTVLKPAAMVLLVPEVPVLEVRVLEVLQDHGNPNTMVVFSVTWLLVRVKVSSVDLVECHAVSLYIDKRCL